MRDVMERRTHTHTCSHTRSHTHAALPLVLLTLCWTHSVRGDGLTVGPPEDLVLVDPGQLGRLLVQWRPPAGRPVAAACQTRYQLEMYSWATRRWKVIQTAETSYSAQFDLSQDVRVRVSTLLQGPCTNGTLLKSATYAKIVQVPERAGFMGPAVQNLSCVFYRMEELLCTWDPGLDQPAHSVLSLYYWHAGLQRARECPLYLATGGARRGCNFSSGLPVFTDVNLCVNGSSPAGRLGPAFASLQTQNHVMPAAAAALHLLAGQDGRLEVSWQPPGGRVPPHCLEWEVEQRQLGGGREQQVVRRLTRQTSVWAPRAVGGAKTCFRVRCRLLPFCASGGFWSPWSSSACHPGSDQDQ